MLHEIWQIKFLLNIYIVFSPIRGGQESKVHLLLLIDEMCMLICLNQDYSKMGVKGTKIKT